MDKSAQGLTSPTFHSVVWVLSMAAILGNSMVIVWRCSRKNNRFKLCSLLIVSLALADLLWCCHFILQEALLVNSVFNAVENETFGFTDVYERLCLTDTFLIFFSCNAIMFTAVGIAVHTALCLYGCRHGITIMHIYMSTSWLASLVIAVSATLELKGYAHNFHTRLSSDAFSLVVMFGCMGDRNMLLYPVLVSSVNAVASIACICIYSCLCCKLKRIRARMGSPEVKQLETRMAIIALLNLVGWWPACIIYWYSYARDKTVFNGGIDPDVTIPILLLSVIVSVVNPIIYTMASKPFCALLKRACIRYHYHDNERGTPLISSSDDQASRCCSATYCCIFKLQRKIDDIGERYALTMIPSESTTTSHLFTETDEQSYYQLV